VYQPELAHLLVDGREVETALAGWVRLSSRALGVLRLPSGRVAACDPGRADGAVPFELAVDPGEHPVRLWTAEAADRGHRIAFAELRFSDAPVAQWAMAFPEGTPRGHRTGDGAEFVGYGVDSGLGCFVDARFLPGLAALGGGDRSGWEDLLDHLHAAGPPDAVVHGLPGGGDVAVFTAGLGDGAQPSSAGTADDGSAVRLVTDFLVLARLAGEYC
jgi:hypothetical protein